MSKRKRNEPARMFQDSWTYGYFFIEWREKPLYLICRKNVSASKLFSVKRHYKSLHEAKYAEFIGKSRENLVTKLKSSLSAQQNTFTKFVARNEKSVIASYVIAEKIARSARPFTDSEFVRECMQEVAKVMLPDKSRLFDDISLSRNSIARRIEDIGKDLSGQYLQKQLSFNVFPWFSMKAVTRQTLRKC